MKNWDAEDVVGVMIASILPLIALGCVIAIIIAAVKG